MKYGLILFFLLPVFSSAQPPDRNLTSSGLNQIAKAYVRLGLDIGQYDPDFVDAYYGPDSLKPTAVKASSFPKDQFLKAVQNLKTRLDPFISNSKDPSLRNKARWISYQLTAFGCRIRMFSGEHISFNQQTKELFGVEPPAYTEDYFRSLLKQLDHLLPGEGSVNSRFQVLSDRFIIPRQKLDTVIKVTISESKKRALRYLTLPATEQIRLEYVTGKSWSGYNWYQGNYTSLIQYNTDVTSSVERVIDIASHEGYPGHHVYNGLLEKNLYKDKGWVEISFYPLFSPQSLIAEGSANFGVEVAFPAAEKIAFVTQELLPLAGLDTSGVTAYFRALAIKSKLLNVRTEVTRRFIDGKMSDSTAIRWLMEYGMFNEKDAVRSLSFTKKYQSYVINYTYGMELVKNYIESNGGTENNPAKRWKLFEWLLSNEVPTIDLQVRQRR